ncbi:MAG: amino acid permease C-terminal domain-containing protein [Geminicoccaceae bacterium]
MPLHVLANLTSMGTLVAFTVVSLGVIILRRTQPQLKRNFRVPLFPYVPLASIAFCLYLILGLPLDTFLPWPGVWPSVAAILYFGYSIRHRGWRRPRPQPNRHRRHDLHCGLRLGGSRRPGGPGAGPPAGEAKASA